MSPCGGPPEGPPWNAPPAEVHRKGLHGMASVEWVMVVGRLRLPYIAPKKHFNSFRHFNILFIYNVSGYQWLSVVISGYQLFISGYQWLSVVISGYQLLLAGYQ